MLIRLIRLMTFREALTMMEALPKLTETCSNGVTEAMKQSRRN